MVGREPVARGLVDWWLAHAPDVRLVNAYGIAELAALPRVDRKTGTLARRA